MQKICIFVVSAAKPFAKMTQKQQADLLVQLESTLQTAEQVPLGHSSFIEEIRSLGTNPHNTKPLYALIEKIDSRLSLTKKLEKLLQDIDKSNIDPSLSARIQQQWQNHQRLTEALRKEMKRYNKLYYREDAPIIYDTAFDMLLKKLEEMEAQNPESPVLDSPTQQVGGSVTKHFPTVVHKYPMLSLANTYSMVEFQEFDARIRKQLGDTSVDYFCEQKFDGVAISLVYEEGYLRQAITRGDGHSGDLITENIRSIPQIPQQVHAPCPPYFEVRAEVFLSKENFEALNAARAAADESLYANARNTASGTLKLQDSTQVADRRLSAYCYGLLCDAPPSTQASCIAHLKTWGFPVSSTYMRCETLKQIEQYIKTWETKRHELPVETDGIVIKIDNLDQQKMLGETAKSPRWAIAYKYAPSTAQTRLLGVQFQVGRTGAITPVAELAPTLLQGSTIRRASLHNQQEIARLDLHIKDLVCIEKGGDVIPKVLSVDPKARLKEAKPVIFPTQCPACKTKLYQHPDEADAYCPNTKACAPQILGRILHFISRKALDISALGKENIRGLLHAGLIQDPGDLYSLRAEHLQGLSLSVEGESSKVRSFQEKSVHNILQGIAASKQIPFARVLFGLGIRHIGETTAQKLAAHFRSLSLLQKAPPEALYDIPDVGEKAAESIQSYFKDPDHSTLLKKLEKAGLQLTLSQAVGPQPLAGKRLVISGTFQNYSREALRTRIQTLGGQLLAAPSQQTDYLIAGQNIGPAKQKKAEKLGVPILSEENFEKLVHDLGQTPRAHTS